MHASIRNTLVFLVPIAFFACQNVSPPKPGESGVPRSITEASQEDLMAQGEILFDRHCSVCHGVDGAGAGPAEAYLFPPARDFTSGKFRLASTENGVPLDSDLVAMLRRGMPGSAMPSWDWLPEENLHSLAYYVRQLAVQGLVHNLRSDAYEAGEELSVDDALAEAEERMTPGRALASVTEVHMDEATLSRGRDLYLRNCASCHGQDGSSTTEPRWNEDGSLNWARDFTAGYLKGGASPEELSWRIQTGLPGSAMPPTELDGRGELGALVSYVRSLIPEGAEAALVQRRERLVVRRSTEGIPLELDDQLWRSSDRIEVVMAPLRWRAESVKRATIQAIHDGNDIAILVSWADPTGEGTVFSDVNTADAVALQFSAAAAPPLFGMGAADHPTNIWHWKSMRLSDVAGALDLLDPTPHIREDARLEEVRVDVPIYHQLEGVPPISDRVEQMKVRGVQTARGSERFPSEVEVLPRWEDGRWMVLFIRPLVTGDDVDLALHPAHSVQMACAIWNGSAGDQGPQKSISIWHELRIEP